MAIATFEDLCAGFCELIKASPPALAADAHGLVAFHLTLRGVTVDLVHCPERSKEHVFIVFELGSISPGDTEAAAQMQALLEGNFNLLRPNSPVFSMNPAAGRAVLQYVYPLFEATPNDLYELIDQEIERISSWREPAPTVEDSPSPGILFQMA